MKVSCLQENLSKGLSIVSRAVSTRSTHLVLANVLLATDNGQMKLAATNFDTSIICWIRAKIEREGAVTIPARTLSDLVNTLPPEQVHLTLDETTQTVNLACHRTEANIKGIDYQEFPLMPKPETENRIKIEAMLLKEMIGQVAFAAATDDTRPMLTGISTQFEGNQITMAATDGFRLSVRHGELQEPVQEKIETIIPARSLNELARVINDEHEFIYISLPKGRNQIIFDLETILVITQLVTEGPFPDYRAVIPNKSDKRTVTILNTAEFAKACKMADIFAREASHTARVSIEPGDEITPGHTTITATSTETGDNVAQLDASVQGKAVEIAFNVKYMTDVLNVVNTPQVALETTDAMEPGVIKPVGNENFTHIIMPMHLGR